MGAQGWEPMRTLSVWHSTWRHASAPRHVSAWCMRAPPTPPLRRSSALQPPAHLWPLVAASAKRVVCVYNYGCVLCAASRQQLGLREDRRGLCQVRPEGLNVRGNGAGA
eukprot:366012-Chlamydomonas_euryale.AAC.9